MSAVRELSFSKDKRVYPKIIKRHQENKAKAEAEQARMNALFTLEVKVDDKQTMDELNGFLKADLSQKLAV